MARERYRSLFDEGIGNVEYRYFMLLINILSNKTVTNILS
jgi:hypothetical protein